MKRRKQLLGSQEGDHGAALLMVLVVVTVIALAGAAMLSFSDTSIRTTVALRDQGAAAYAANGAAQVAISKIQSGELECSSTTPEATPLGTSTSPFYVPVQSRVGPLNASIICSPNTTEGASSTTATTSTGSGVAIGGTASNLPVRALLAMGGSAISDTGIVFSSTPKGKTICIENGDVVSNEKINATDVILGVRLGGTGTASDCTTGSSIDLTVGAADATSWCVGGSSSFDPTPCTHLASQITLPTTPPQAPPPPTDAITRTNPTATCHTLDGKQYAAFLPGKYTIVTRLNSPCSGTTHFEWFSPGTYYFDFGSTTWNWPATLLAGTPTDSSGTPIAVNATVASSLAGLADVALFPTVAGQKPKSCADPALQSSSPGAEFVFGGASKFKVNDNGNAEICASYSSTGPPVAIYGANTALTVTGGSLSAQTLCPPSGCSGSLIGTGTSKRSQFYIMGMVYAPNAPIALTVQNSLGQLFNWGVVVRKFSLSVKNNSPSAPFIQLPSENPGVTTTTSTTTSYTIRYINVWTCKASADACPQTGAPNVRVKIQTNGSSVKVLSWSIQR